MRRERSATVTRLVLLVALASVLSAVGKPLLGTGGAGDMRLRRCTPEGYGLAWSHTSPKGNAPQAVRLTAGWLTAREKRRSCQLQTTIHLAISGSSGVAATADWHVNSVRRPWSAIMRTWIWRNWCDTDPSATATIALSAPGERTISDRFPDPPVCVSSGSPSTLTDLGTGTKNAPRSDRIPPHILPKSVPPPLHRVLINPKNAWLVSDGYTLVAVYAGSPGVDPPLGRFAIIRQNETFGVQYEPPELVDAGRVGAVTIIHPPRGRSRETTAQSGKLAFVSTNGTKGFLDLRTDRIRITSRP